MYTIRPGEEQLHTYYMLNTTRKRAVTLYMFLTSIMHVLVGKASVCIRVRRVVTVSTCLRFPGRFSDRFLKFPKF